MSGSALEMCFPPTRFVPLFSAVAFFNFVCALAGIANSFSSQPGSSDGESLISASAEARNELGPRSRQA
jgi:hypothetical protein